MTAYSNKDRGRSTRIEGGSTKNFLEVPKTAQSGSSYSTLLLRVHEVSEQTGPNFRTSPISAELSVYWDSLGHSESMSFLEEERGEPAKPHFPTNADRERSASPHHTEPLSFVAINKLS